MTLPWKLSKRIPVQEVSEIDDALSFDVAGDIVWAQRMTKGGISASVDSAKLHRLGEVL